MELIRNNHGDFKEIKPGGRPFVKIYLWIMLWFLGRTIQAAAKVDADVKQEFEALPDGFTMILTAAPNGPSMVIGKDENGKVKYKGRRCDGLDFNVKITIKSIEAFFLILTFRESTCMANARNRLYAEGRLPEACASVRVIDIAQVYLLPKPIAKLAVKRYPKWGLKRHIYNRLLIFARTIIGL